MYEYLFAHRYTLIPIQMIGYSYVNSQMLKDCKMFQPSHHACSIAFTYEWTSEVDLSARVKQNYKISTP